MSRSVIVVLTVLLAVAGCGGGGEGGETMSTTFTTTTTSTASTILTTTTTAPTPTSTPVVLGSGANAAPQAPARIATAELFNNSAEAARNFRWWIEYETPADYWDKYATSQVVADKLLVDGKGVCVSLSQGIQHGTTIAVLQQLPYAYNITEAHAIHMAAVQTLCPHRLAGMQLTDIDRNARTAYGEVPKFMMADGTPLMEYDVVWAGKYACYYLSRFGFTGLEAFLRTYSNRVRVADRRLQNTVMEQVVGVAVLRQCIPQHKYVVNQPWVR